jgi:hypothetical protein
MLGLRKTDSPPPVLVVIGAHREELAFGQSVCESLDPERFSILRIPQGISGKRPRADQQKKFLERHQALYLQILNHIQPGQRLLIDLHQGVDSRGPSADILCADTSLLQPLCAHQSALRCIQLVSNTKMARHTDNSLHPLVAKPDIPEAVWKHPDTLYLGLEIYLSDKDSIQELTFARRLIEEISDRILQAKSACP